MRRLAFRCSRLPDGFRYQSFSWTGDMMADDVRCPNLHDGMAVVDVQGNSGHLVLVRNHEGAAGGPYVEKPSITYADDGAGGTTNLIFDARHGEWKKDWSSLAGTIRNCAGGVTPWGTWISGEETGDPATVGALKWERRKGIADLSSTWDGSRTKR